MASDDACPVCREPLGPLVSSLHPGTPALPAVAGSADTDDAPLPACALPCGHRFHVECIMLALLGDSNWCPTCHYTRAARHGMGVGVGVGGGFAARAGGGAGGGEGDDEHDDENAWADADSDSDADDGLAAMQHQLHIVRSEDGRVRRWVRAARDLQVRANAERQRLRGERRRVIALALAVLRRAELRGWKSLEKLQARTLRRLRAVEAAALRRRFGDAAVPIPRSAYQPPTAFSMGLEPTQRRFWTL